MLRHRRNGWWTTCLVAGCTIATWLACASSAHAYKVLVTDGGAAVHWREHTVTLRVSEELEAHLHDLPVTDVIGEAAATWSALTGVPELLVKRGCSDAPGFEPGASSINGVYLVREWTLLPNALAVTVTTFETSTGRLVDSDVLVNSNFAFALVSADDSMTAQRYDLLSVLTHELGHVLGLGDASDEPDATMWPSIVVGDTHQRDLAADDEAGAASIYPNQDVDEQSELAGGAGCGGASVLQSSAGAPSHRAALVLLLLMLLWLCARSTGSARRYRTILLGGALLFGGPAPAAAPTVADDSDAEGKVLGDWLPHDHPAAQRRLDLFFDGADRLVRGRAHTRVERRAGLLWTRVRLHTASSDVELDVPGGTLDGLTQLVSGHAAPQEGELLLVARRRRGPHAWAHLRDGLLYGGSLGDGPAVQWE